MDTKRLGGHYTEVKQEEVNGVTIGIIAGYIATWDLDRGDWCYKDQFVQGAFSESIQEFKAKRRMPRFKDHHGRTIGGWRFETLREDNIGLFGEAEVNLDVQQGREAYSMAKQGVLTDFSVGFSADVFIIDEVNGIRTIPKATLWEGSIVDEPMNPNANVTEVKISAEFQDLPLAETDQVWEPEAAKDRVRQFSDSVESPSESYKNAFLFCDAGNSQNFDGYTLQIADVIDGQLKAIPKAMFAAAAAMRGANKGIVVHESSVKTVEAQIKSYYQKMGRESPLKEKCLEIDSIDVKNLTERELEGMLSLESVKFTTQASKTLVSYFDVKALRDAGKSVARDAAKKEAEQVETKMDELLKLLEIKNA